MHVQIDESRQDQLSLCVNRPSADRNGQLWSYSRDLPVFDEYIGYSDKPTGIDDPTAFNHNRHDIPFLKLAEFDDLTT
jgi:hypothetical protein